MERRRSSRDDRRIRSRHIRTDVREIGSYLPLRRAGDSSSSRGSERLVPKHLADLMAGRATSTPQEAAKYADDYGAGCISIILHKGIMVGIIGGGFAAEIAVLDYLQQPFLPNDNLPLKIAEGIGPFALYLLYSSLVSRRIFKS